MATRTARRYDFSGSELRSPVSRGSDGAVLYEGIPVREGILRYRNADGSERLELVTLQAVKDTLKTGVRAPVTLDHPSSGFVNEDSAGDLVVGDVDGEGAVYEDAVGGFGRIKIAVRRRDALDAIAAGTHELSPGYDVDLDETPGEHPVFGRYDARQVGRRVNHIAIVQKGRGDRVALRTDSDDAVQVGSVSPSPRRSRTDHGALMNPLLSRLLTIIGVSNLDGEDAALREGAELATSLKTRADQADTQKTRADAAEEGKDEWKGKYEDMKSKYDELSGKYDALKSKMDEMEGEAKKKADAAELADLQNLAASLKVDSKDLELPALRVAIAKTRIDSLDGKSDDYVSAVIDSIKADVQRADTGRSRWDWGNAPTREDGNPAKPPPRGRDGGETFTSHLDRADEALNSVSGGVQ